MSEKLNFVSPYLKIIEAMELSKEVPEGTLRKVVNLGRELANQRVSNNAQVALRKTKGTKTKRPFSQREINLIFEKTRSHFERTGRFKPLLFFAIGIYTGLRVSDILSVTWGNLLEGYSKLPGHHNKEDYFLILEKKSRRFGQERTIHINRELRMIIDYVHRTRANRRKREMDAFVFASPVKGRPVATGHVRNEFYKYVHQAGLDHIKDRIGTHSLRKTFAWNMYRSLGSNDAAKEVVKQVIGHKSVETTEIYLGMDKQSLKDAYFALQYRPESLYDIQQYK